jgi:predicted nucleic acid-binding protein
VAIAAIAPWHEAHEIAAPAATGGRLTCHTAAETYAVLTRLPPLFRVPPDAAREAIDGNFPAAYLPLSPAGYRTLISTAAAGLVGGGAIYDAVVAAAALEAGAVLLTRDDRARRIYDLVGVTYEYVR